LGPHQISDPTNKLRGIAQTIEGSRFGAYSHDVLNFDPSKPAKYPNGRVFSDDVIDYRLAFLMRPPSGLKPHTDILREFPYLGTPHQKES